MRIVSFIITHASIIIAAIAFVGATITAWIQIKLQKQEWRPYLSFIKTEIISDPLVLSDALRVGLKIQLKNVGKTILRYEFQKLTITHTEVGHPVNFADDMGNISSILSVNAETFHDSGRRLYMTREELSECAKAQSCSLEEKFEAYTGPLEINSLIDKGLHELIWFEVDFLIKYWKVDKPKESYVLKYQTLVYIDKKGNCLEDIWEADAD